MKDFFISYTGKDVDRATWVAELLESEHYEVVIQEWDFRPGDNFVSKINSALKECRRMILILSGSYLESSWCEAEWTAKLKEQIEQRERTIIPVQVEKVALKGLLAPIVYIDIVDLNEDEARTKILNGIRDHVPRKSNGYKPDYNLDHEEFDIDYYVGKDEIRYIKTCRSTALVDGMNSIHSRVTWFVDEEVKIESLTEGVRIDLLDLKDTNTNFNIVFPGIIKAGDLLEYRFQVIASNKHHHFMNFFSSEIIAPVGRININLNLEDETVKKVYTQKLSSSPMNGRTAPPEEHVFSNPYHWHIDDPELHFEYKIYW